MAGTAERVDRSAAVFASFRERTEEALAQRVRHIHPADAGRMPEIDLPVAGREHLMVVEAKRDETTQLVNRGQF